MIVPMLSHAVGTSLEKISKNRLLWEDVGNSHDPQYCPKYGVV